MIMKHFEKRDGDCGGVLGNRRSIETENGDFMWALEHRRRSSRIERISWGVLLSLEISL